MKISSLVTIASFALALGIGAAHPQAEQKPGMKEFNVDITGAGNTKEQNQQFMQGLTPEQQAKVKEVCLVAVTEPEGTHPPEVVAFCRNVNPPT